MTCSFFTYFAVLFDEENEDVFSQGGGGFLLLVGNILHDVPYITLQNAAKYFDGVSAHAFVAL